MSRKRAFTLVELLVLIAVIALLVTILAPIFMGCSSLSEGTVPQNNLGVIGRNRAMVCQNTLGIIGRKYNDYANEAENHANPFSRHIDDGDAHDTTAATGLKTAHTLDVAIGTCGMQSVWGMIDRGYLPDTAFKCPGDADWTSRSSPDMYGWSALTKFSYGIHYPYSSNGAGTRNAADPNAREPAIAQRLLYRENMVLFADRNPGGAVDGTTRFHTNHRGTDGGCIVVSRVGNTKFHQSATDSKAGFGDDIYTDSNLDNAGAPVVPADNFIPDNTTDTVITPQVSR